MLDSRPIASPSKSARRNIRPFVYGCMILVVFIAAVTMMSMKDGASGALLTALGAVALAATGVGVWGTAVAVKETHDLGSHTED
ncbi:MAG TPA: hypothetical protein VII76_06035 [Acidimicrobiales bacterium]